MISDSDLLLLQNQIIPVVRSLLGREEDLEEGQVRSHPESYDRLYPMTKSWNGATPVHILIPRDSCSPDKYPLLCHQMAHEVVHYLYPSASAIDGLYLQEGLAELCTSVVLPACLKQEWISPIGRNGNNVSYECAFRLVKEIVPEDPLRGLGKIRRMREERGKLRLVDEETFQKHVPELPTQHRLALFQRFYGEDGQNLNQPCGVCSTCHDRRCHSIK